MKNEETSLSSGPESAASEFRAARSACGILSLRGLVTAFRTLTIVRVPGRDAESPAQALPFFPVIGGLLGLLVAALAWAVGKFLGWPLGAGALCVAISSLATGGLHIDGLADAFDSLAGRTREQKLAIMKDSRIGSYGAIALGTVLLLKFVAIARLAQFERFAWLVVPFVVARAVQVQIVALVCYARPEGGTAQTLVEQASWRHFAAAFPIAAAACFAAAGTTGVMLLLAGCGAGFLCAGWMRRQYGGATGDLIGMASETVETGALLALALSAI